MGAELVVKVAPPDAQEIARLADGSVLIGFLAPLTRGETMPARREKGSTAFAMEAIPRISGAQVMDTLRASPASWGTRRC